MSGRRKTPIMESKPMIMIRFKGALQIKRKAVPNNKTTRVRPATVPAGSAIPKCDWIKEPRFTSNEVKFTPNKMSISSPIPIAT